MSEQYGIFKVKDYHSDTGKKALKVFEKLKNKADESDKVKHDPRLNEHDDETYFNQLRRDAMKSLHLTDEVEKTEEGFVLWVGL